MEKNLQWTSPFFFSHNHGDCFPQNCKKCLVYHGKRRRALLKLLQKCSHLQTRGNHICSIHQVESEIILNFCRIGTSVGREIWDFVSGESCTCCVTEQVHTYLGVPAALRSRYTISQIQNLELAGNGNPTDHRQHNRFIRSRCAHDILNFCRIGTSVGREIRNFVFWEVVCLIAYGSGTSIFWCAW